MKNNAKNLITLPNFSAIDPKTNFGRFLGSNGTVLEHFVRNWQSGVVGQSSAEVENKTLEKRALETYLLIKMEFTKRFLKICTGQWTTTMQSCLDQSYMQLPPAMSQSANMKFQIADALFWGNWSNQMNSFIDNLLGYQANFLMMYSIITEEQSHLMPPYYEDIIIGLIKDNDTVGLSQIQMRPNQSDKNNFGYTDSARSDLLNPKSHLVIMNDRINKIRGVLKRLWQAETAENIGRAWNGWYNCINGSSLCPDSAISYWKRIKDYSENLRSYYETFTKN